MQIVNDPSKGLYGEPLFDVISMPDGSRNLAQPPCSVVNEAELGA